MKNQKKNQKKVRNQRVKTMKKTKMPKNLKKQNNL